MREKPGSLPKPLQALRARAARMPAFPASWTCLTNSLWKVEVTSAAPLILKSDRGLTLAHVRKLAERFQVSTALFVG